MCSYVFFFMQGYDYSLDMWSLGCMFAGIVSFLPTAIVGLVIRLATD